MACARRNAGVTLVELMVVLVLLAVMAGIVGISWRPDPSPRARGTDARAVIAAARLRAIESGASITVAVMDGERRIEVTARPDGRLVGAARLGLDPLTGLPRE